MRLTAIKARMNWLGDHSAEPIINLGCLNMTSDMIEIWAGILGLAYLAAAGLYLAMPSAGKRNDASVDYGLGRHARPHPVKVRHSR